MDTQLTTPPNVFDHLDRIRSIVRSGRLGLHADFDGTLSPIAPTPEAAQISPRAAVALQRLVSQISLVSVVSGRSIHDVKQKVDIDGILYVGNHGAEYLENGRLRVAPGIGEYVDKIVEVLAHLRDKVDIQGLVWDYKRYSLAVQYRQTERPDETKLTLREAWETFPDAALFELFWSKMVMEIRPPIGIDKGYAVKRLIEVRRLDSVIMIGDDTTDVDAFRTIRRLRGTQGAGILVLHDDTAQVLRESSDYSLNGVEEVEKFLEWLVAVTDGTSHE